MLGKEHFIFLNINLKVKRKNNGKNSRWTKSLKRSKS